MRLLSVLCALLAFACDKKGQKKPDEASAKPSAAADPGATKGAPEAPADPGGAASVLKSTPQRGPEVKLLSPGTPPLRAMSLHPKAGDTQRMVVTMKTAMEMRMGGMTNPPIKLPPMRMSMSMTVKSVSPEGDIAYDFLLDDAEVLEEPGVMPQVATAMRTALSSAKGMSGSGVMSRHGINKGTQLTVPKGADPQLRQLLEGMKDSLNQIAAPLPVEPIGRGAKWEVKMTLLQQGMTLEQTATYELISIEGERGTAKSTVAQVGANQKIQNPSMPAVKMDLVKLDAKGSGEVTFDLGRIVPPRATGDIHSEATMAMDMGTQKQTMSMKMDMNIKVEAK
jgi:hypothetical protein